MFKKIVRSSALTFALLAGVLTAVGAPLPAEATSVRRITLPVALDRLDDVHWTDTWGAPRSGGRSHVGVDMLGPKMVPLVAARDGVISWMRHDTQRGNILYLEDDEGWTYVYIHINNDTPGTDDGANRYEEAFAPGIERGARVTEGQVIAYMGDSGNAEWTASHLHFEVVDPNGRNHNPAPIVDAALANINTPPPAADPDDPRTGSLGSYQSISALTDGFYTALQGRSPTRAERSSFEQAATANGTAAAIAERLDRDAVVAQVERLYVTYLQRIPDTGGLRYWVGVRADGYSVHDLARYFAASPEYQFRFGHQTEEAFVEGLYRDILGRSSDAEGKAYWVDILETGQLNRGTIGIYFSESEEQKIRSEQRSEVVTLSLAFFDRVPTSAEMAAWKQLRTSVNLTDAIEQTFLSPPA